MPAIAKGVPLLLEVDPGLELDELRHYFQFEIVSEHEDGFVIVAAEDVDLNLFLQKINDFVGTVAGSASIAKVHELHEDPTAGSAWSVSSPTDCWPNGLISGMIRLTSATSASSASAISRSQSPQAAKARVGRRVGEPRVGVVQGRDQAYRRWDELRITREQEVEHFVPSYGGTILNILDDAAVERRCRTASPSASRSSGGG